MSKAMDTELLKVKGLSFRVDDDSNFRDIHFSIDAGKGYVIVCENENASNILLKSAAGLLPGPLEPGYIFFKGKDVYSPDEKEIKEIRKEMVFVFREGTMISNLTVQENLFLPLLYHYPNTDKKTAMEKIAEDFNFLGIPDVSMQRPAEISFYDKKKLAFIRAALQQPNLILMDRPLFNLDSSDQEQVVRYLTNLKKKGVAFLMESQSRSILDALADEVIIIEEGKPAVTVGKEDPAFTKLADLFR